VNEGLALALGASLAWGISDFVGPLWGRTFGALPMMLWGQVAGFIAICVVAAVRGNAPHHAVVLLAVPAAASGTLGLFAYYRGMKVGAMTVVAPIAGASAVIPVAFGVASGDSPSAGQIAGVACAILGVALASIEHQEGARRTVAAGVGLALLAAVGFGFYFPAMHAAGKADFWWASVIFRTSALVLVTLVVVAQRAPVRLSARPLAVAAAAGLGDTVGNVLYAAASGHGLVSLTSVLASLYPVVTVLLAARILRERVSSVQRAGIALTLAGVVLISA
jgi:drug/metabolite transporter (DMT)-like permease